MPANRTRDLRGHVAAIVPTAFVVVAFLLPLVGLLLLSLRPTDQMNNVLPGWIDSLPEKDERREGVPMKRYGTAEEIAATVAFLLSDEAGYITGQNIRVDGGLMRSVL